MYYDLWTVVTKDVFGRPLTNISVKNLNARRRVDPGFTINA